MDLTPFRKHPNTLTEHYRTFRVSERLLLTGHSHQAWPDCSLGGQTQAWHDAAEMVDEKWDLATDKAEEVQDGFRALLNDKACHIALGQNTFDLVLRFISALPLRQRPRLITTASEFHSLRRLLDRLGEEGVEIIKVATRPFNTFMQRLYQTIDENAAAVLCSHVFFDSGIIAGDYSSVAKRCEQAGCELLIDAYHSLNVVPFSVAEHKLENAYIVGGGYKYCQLGEGNCFLRFPKDSQLRPIATGWFSEFDLIADSTSGQTHYGRGAARFAGSTYDPSSHYRAAEVFAFFRSQALTPEKLRQLSQHQIGLLRDQFLQLDLDPAIIALDSEIELQHRAGFLALKTPRAQHIHVRLKESGVLTDYRDNRLRFGPAPYLSDRQLSDAISALKNIV